MIDASLREPIQALIEVNVGQDRCRVRRRTRWHWQIGSTSSGAWTVPPGGGATDTRRQRPLA
jgi:hypothetical protein